MIKKIILLSFVFSFSLANASEYPLLGITLGLPAGWNFIGGYIFEDYGVLASGMYRSENLSGGQININEEIVW